MNCSALHIELMQDHRTFESVFAGCIWLKSVDIPEGITVILDDAFASLLRAARTDCNSQRVTKIPASAFSSCENLKTVEYSALVLNERYFHEFWPTKCPCSTWFY